jgi:hypothetical protein
MSADSDGDFEIPSDASNSSEESDRTLAPASAAPPRLVGRQRHSAVKRRHAPPHSSEKSDADEKNAGSTTRTKRAKKTRFSKPSSTNDNENESSIRSDDASGDVDEEEDEHGDDENENEDDGEDESNEDASDVNQRKY